MQKEVICTQYDGFGGDTTIWVAKLNDGREVYQDDGREGYEESSAWLRLIAHCKENGQYLTGFRVQFRDHVEHMPDNAEGYFFSLGCAGIWGINITFNQFVMGYLENGEVHITKWKVPEIIVMETCVRSYEACKHLLIERL